MLRNGCFPDGSVKIYVGICESLHLVCQFGSSWMLRTILPTGLHRKLHRRWSCNAGMEVFRRVSFQVVFDGKVLPFRFSNCSFVLEVQEYLPRLWIDGSSVFWLFFFVCFCRADQKLCFQPLVINTNHQQSCSRSLGETNLRILEQCYVTRWKGRALENVLREESCNIMRKNKIKRCSVDGSTGTFHGGEKETRCCRLLKIVLKLLAMCPRCRKLTFRSI